MSSTRRIIRYSEAFKLQVLDEVVSGDLSLEEARRKYGIKGTGTIQSWARKYGSFGVLPKLIRVVKPDEKEQIKKLKTEIRRLKEALADSVLGQKIAESTLEVICEQRGWDVEEIKKKAGERLQQRRLKKGKK